jgi:hypothetical protein
MLIYLQSKTLHIFKNSKLDSIIKDKFGINFFVKESMSSKNKEVVFRNAFDFKTELLSAFYLKEQLINYKLTLQSKLIITIQLLYKITADFLFNVDTETGNHIINENKWDTEQAFIKDIIVNKNITDSVVDSYADFVRYLINKCKSLLTDGINKPKSPITNVNQINNFIKNKINESINITKLTREYDPFQHNIQLRYCLYYYFNTSKGKILYDELLS